MIVFYARWQRNGAYGVQDTQIIVQDGDGIGNPTVTTIRNGTLVSKGVADINEAMENVNEIVRRLGEGQ